MHHYHTTCQVLHVAGCRWWAWARVGWYTPPLLAPLSLSRVTPLDPHKLRGSCCHSRIQRLRAVGGEWGGDMATWRVTISNGKWEMGSGRHCTESLCCTVMAFRWMGQTALCSTHVQYVPANVRVHVRLLLLSLLLPGPFLLRLSNPYPKNVTYLPFQPSISHIQHDSTTIPRYTYKYWAGPCFVYWDAGRRGSRRDKGQDAG